MNRVSCSEQTLSATHTIHASRHFGARVGGSGHMWLAMMLRSRRLSSKSCLALLNAMTGWLTACALFSQ